MRRKLHLHDLSKEHDFSCDMGQLIPTHFRMVYPNDVVRQRSDFMVRVSPMLAPIVSRVNIKAESFYVPTDVVWTSAAEFYSRGQGGASTKTIPKTNITGPDPLPGQLFNHLGVGPAANLATISVNVLPNRVYNAICNWHYFDQDLDTPLAILLTDSSDDQTTARGIQNRRWERDRFTTARLEPQRGDDVLIPSGIATGDVVGNGDQINVRFSGAPTTERPLVSGTATGGTNFMLGSVAGAGGQTVSFSDDPTKTGLETEVDMSTGAGTIRELEEAVAINRFRSRLQQADGSYPDYCLATFGIRAPDIELQKPVLLARSSSPLQISEIIQTSPDTEADPDVGVGTLRGHGIAVARGHAYKYKIKRHGYIMTIFSCVPKTLYAQATDKEFFRTTAEDYYDPDIDMIGEEIVENREIYPAHSNPTGTFGFQYRNYCDRSALSHISGELQTSVLNFWHQGRTFTGDIALNSSFITCNPTDRIFALGSTVDQLRVKAMHEVKILRTMPRIPAKGIL